MQYDIDKSIEFNEDVRRTKEKPKWRLITRRSRRKNLAEKRSDIETWKQITK